ncbi:retrotransposon protein [Tanacetum coccineum]
MVSGLWRWPCVLGGGLNRKGTSSTNLGKSQRRVAGQRRVAHIAGELSIGLAANKQNEFEKYKALSDEDIDDEEEAEAFKLMARNFRKGGESSKQKGACYNYGIEGHFASECKKPKENKAFIGGAWSDNEDGNEHQNDATCLMAIDSQEVVSKPSSSNNTLNIIDLQNENEELIKFNKDFTKTFEKLLNEKRSLESKNSKLSSKINDLEIEVKKLENDKEVVEP